MLVSLTADGEFLYWISKVEDSTQIYQAKKSNGAILSQVEAPRSKHILVYSSVLQPFPGRKVTFFYKLVLPVSDQENLIMSPPPGQSFQLFIVLSALLQMLRVWCAS